MVRLQKHRDIPDSESAVPVKRLSRLCLWWGLLASCVGVALILTGVIASKFAPGYGSTSFSDPWHFAILAGVAVLLYLGLLPILVGGVLWVFAKRMAKTQ
jgi:hypothetical protein